MKKLSIFLTAFLFLTMAAGCSSGTSDTLSEGNNPAASFTKEIEPSASFTEAQLIHAFTSQGYSVIQNDPELDIEALTVSIVEMEFQREQNGLTDSGGLLYIEFSDAKFCTELYQQYMGELAEDGIVPNTKSGNDWDYAYKILEDDPLGGHFHGCVYYRNKNVFILMHAEWEDYLHTGNAFDYLPMTIAENLVF